MSDWVTDNARVVIAAMVLASAVVAAGVPMVDRSTSLDQFQTDASEADALDYVDANFSTGTADTTSAQVVVQDGDVLDKETLVSILEYERALETNETVKETLIRNDATRSVANLVATAAIREDRAADLQTRERELERTEAELADALDSLARNPNASVRHAFDTVEANTSITLTDEEYALFADAAEQRRDSADGTTTRNSTAKAPTHNETTNSTRTLTEQILADEYANLAEERRRVADLDPTLENQTEALRSLNDSEVKTLATDVLAGDSERSARALAFMPDYYDAGATETNATLLVVTQETAGGSFAPGDAPDVIEDAQAAMTDLAPDDDSMSVLVYGDGVVSTEITDSMFDSVLLVGPLAVAFVLLVLVVVYRDLLDILLGLLGIALVLVWTFGVMGWFDIAFSQPFIVVLVLLIGLSIDYGLHVVMRYREARESSETPPSQAMAIALGSVGVALVYVTTTTVIGFLSNLTSPLAVFRELGVVSAIGIVATLLIFALFVPALKVELDQLFETRGIDRVKPAVGTGSGLVGRLLSTGAMFATKAPYVVIVVALLVSTAGAYGATDIDASFEQSDFLAEDPEDWLKDLPDPIAPGTYTAETVIDTLDRDFVRHDTTATILVRGNVADPATLDKLEAARSNASDMSATDTYADGEPAVTSPVTVMDRIAADNESFNRTLSVADTDDDGRPDRNVTAVYDELYRVAPEEAADVVHREDGEYQAVRMVVTIDGGVEDGVVRNQMEWIADDADWDGVSAIATGDVIVNQITADQLAETALLSLVVALLSVVVVLAAAYRVTEGSASLGVVTIMPVAFTLTWVLGTMALLDIPFNIVTGMITGLTIGLGVDYSVHVSERFNQELTEAETVAAALHETVTGTGGALLSSAATTASGFAVLLVAILPFLQSFGLITALTIVFAFLASVFVLPSLLVIWARLVDRNTDPGPTSSGGPAGVDSEATRKVHRRFVASDESVPVTVSLQDVHTRVAIKEIGPGDINDVVVDPDPVVVDRDGECITVYWDIDAVSSEATLQYTVDLAGKPADGDVVTFGGTVEEAAAQYAVGGDEAVTVVEDVCQRALERGEVTSTDVEIAVERDDVTVEEVARLRRAWLAADSHSTESP